MLVTWINCTQINFNTCHFLGRLPCWIFLYMWLVRAKFVAGPRIVVKLLLKTPPFSVLGASFLDIWINQAQVHRVEIKYSWNIDLKVGKKLQIIGSTFHKLLSTPYWLLHQWIAHKMPMLQSVLQSLCTLQNVFAHVERWSLHERSWICSCQAFSTYGFVIKCDWNWAIFWPSKALIIQQEWHLTNSGRFLTTQWTDNCYNIQLDD